MLDVELKNTCGDIEQQLARAVADILPKLPGGTCKICYDHDKRQVFLTSGMIVSPRTSFVLAQFDPYRPGDKTSYTVTTSDGVSYLFDSIAFIDLFVSELQALGCSVQVPKCFVTAERALEIASTAERVTYYVDDDLADKLGLAGELFDSGDDERLQYADVVTWICTDTSVGLRVLFLDGQPMALYFKSCRRCDEQFIWMTQDHLAAVRDYVASVMVRREEPASMLKPGLLPYSWNNSIAAAIDSTLLKGWP